MDSDHYGRPWKYSHGYRFLNLLERTSSSGSCIVQIIGDSAMLDASDSKIRILSRRKSSILDRSSISRISRRCMDRVEAKLSARKQDTDPL